MTRACRHESADHLMPGDMFATWNEPCSERHLVLAEQLRCLDCGTWLPLGPANESRVEVQIEVRAAELTASRRRNRNPKFAYTGEWWGFRDFNILNDSPDENDCPPEHPTLAAQWHAGYLAAAIVETDTESEG